MTSVPCQRGHQASGVNPYHLGLEQATACGEIVDGPLPASLRNACDDLSGDTLCNAPKNDRITFHELHLVGVFFMRMNVIAPVTQDLANIQFINVNNAVLAAPVGEETLDVEWSSGIAPAAQVKIYASGTLAFSNVDKCLQKLIADLPTEPNLHQVSISLGLGETYVSGAQSFMWYSGGNTLLTLNFELLTHACHLSRLRL